MYEKEYTLSYEEFKKFTKSLKSIDKVCDKLIESLNLGNDSVNTYYEYKIKLYNNIFILFSNDKNKSGTSLDDSLNTFNINKNSQ